MRKAVVLRIRDVAGAARRIEHASTPDDVVRIASRSAAGIGVPGILAPGFDEAAMYTIWFAMVTTIARRSGAELSPATAAKLVSAAVGAAAAYSLGSKILSWGVIAALSSIPFAALPAAMAMNAGLNALLTHRLGHACAERFADPKFRVADIAGIVRHLALVPSMADVLAVRRMLTGRA